MYVEMDLEVISYEFYIFEVFNVLFYEGFMLFKVVYYDEKY